MYFYFYLIPYLVRHKEPNLRMMTVRVAVQYRMGRCMVPHESPYSSVRWLPYGGSHTVPYGSPYSTLRVAVQYRMGRRMVPYESYGGSYGIVRLCTVWYHTMSRKVPYGPSYGTRTAHHREIPDESPYGTIWVAVRCLTSRHTVPYV